ncbi:hypothetical protein PhaeoP66_03258 [Phaeobacter inhibens]|uniref:Uncharacterized protein n=1 Tax=Phaeobacter inhibens TaxID=221822 RepID=A0ABN5GRI2_9RHOB|nr:hypothetical protein [Phaeobacter inhibens]AUQ96000.1 hypothetical protein PhaeoP66_03258 [Phaeobacter inhibens]
MKAFKDAWLRSGTPFTAKEAVAKQLTPDPYESGGRIEELESKVENLTEAVSALYGLLYDKAVLAGEDITNVCPGVEEDLDALG